MIRDFGNGWDGHTEPDRFGEITTRQDIQVHWISFDQLPEVWRRYDAAGLTSAQACGDSMRNPTACPVDGDDPRGYVRVTPLLDEFQTFAMTNERMTAFLPRKWKVVVTGCPTDCSAVKLHCLAFTPARAADGTLGFHPHIGGGLSDTPRIADELDFFVRPDQVTDTVRATLEVYREFGDFDHKAVNRFRVLVHEMGPERVGSEIRQRIGSETAPAGESLWTGEHEDHLGVHEDGRGSHYVGLCIPMGRLTDDEWFEVARLARTHGDGGIRMSQRQNLMLSGITDVDALLAEPFLERYRPEPDPFERSIIACTSSPFCKFAIDDMKTNGKKLVAHLQERLPVEGRERLEGLQYPHERLQGRLRADPGGAHRVPRDDDEGRGGLRAGPRRLARRRPRRLTPGQVGPRRGVRGGRLRLGDRSPPRDLCGRDEPRRPDPGGRRALLPGERLTWWISKSACWARTARCSIRPATSATT